MDSEKIITIIIDCDGVLTDGKINMTSAGDLFRSFHSRDIRAIRELIARGFEVIICTASSSPIIKAYADKVGAVLEVERDKKLIANQHENFIAIGDDVWDVPLLEKAKHAFCPNDADRSCFKVPGIKVLPFNGGSGVIAELVHEINKLEMRVA